MHLGLVAIVVSQYDPAIRFFTDVLGFELVEDSPSLTNDGRAKRWVVVRPPGAVTGLLLAQADGEDQAAVVGRQTAGRVGFFLHVEDFGAAYARMSSAGVRFLTEPRTEPYGQVVVFLDIAGNKWDLIGPGRDDGGDRFDLQRFVTAQDSGGTYGRATAELRAGRKASHWMWFVFPQFAGLGYSPTARAYAITSLAEARAYLAHPVLGPRLTECAAILSGVPGRTAEQIFGEVDALKLRSCMTLFTHAAPGEPVFRQVLEQYFDGIPDPATEQRI